MKYACSRAGLSSAWDYKTIRYTIDVIKEIVQSHVPKPVGTWRYYSVLLPLVEKDGLLYVLYELRAADLDIQPGEISFPGGGIETGETPAEAALRETAEELGVPETAVEIITELDYLLSYSNLKIHCFLGVIDAAALEIAAINKAEVEEYFLTPLNWLLENDPEIYVNNIVQEPAANLPVEKLTPRGGYNWRTGTSTVPVYIWPDPQAGKERVIWGMTARLTMAFTDLLRSGKALSQTV